MLQLSIDNNCITEIMTTAGTNQFSSNGIQHTSNGYWDANGNYAYPYYPTQIYWMNYPIYVTTDKTKKAIEILKTLQAEKLLECKSVNKFIELVEKISNIL